MELEFRYLYCLVEPGKWICRCELLNDKYRHWEYDFVTTSSDEERKEIESLFLELGWDEL